MQANTYSLTLDPGGTNLFCDPFTADTLTHAQALAQSVSTLFARTLYLVPLDGGTEPYGAFTPGSQGGTVSSPTGIS